MGKIKKHSLYEDIAQRAQRYVSSKPVLVFGTGATIPHGLPSMGDLADALLKAPTLRSKDYKKFRNLLSKSKDLELTLQEVSLAPSAINNIVDITWQLVRC